MTADPPWQGDACSLVDAFRSGDRSPREELESVLAAIERSSLGAFPHLDPSSARASADAADISLPFGGVPVGIKELSFVEGWPNTAASLVFRDRIAEHDDTNVARLRAAGAVLAGATLSSEFGGLNIGINRIGGVCRNPWDVERTPGGSSAGSAAAVAGGLIPIASGGDGGGSIRIPAGFCGLVGMKGTAGRIPRGPRTEIHPMTVVLGCLARSVRDVARWFDACAGHDPRDPYSLPDPGGWEIGLDSHDTRGLRVAISPTLGSAVVRDEVAALVEDAGRALAGNAGLRMVDAKVDLPGLGVEWALANLVQLRRKLGPLWPGCREDLTAEIAFGMQISVENFDLDMAARVEDQRIAANEAMADVFDQADVLIAATNPDVAFGAEVTLNTSVDGRTVRPENNGALTIPANVTGNPAVSIPIGAIDGMPVGMQVIGPHHHDAVLLDLARIVERARPWPLVAPGSPV